MFAFAKTSSDVSYVASACSHNAKGHRTTLLNDLSSRKFKIAICLHGIYEFLTAKRKFIIAKIIQIITHSIPFVLNFF